MKIIDAAESLLDRLGQTSSNQEFLDLIDVSITQIIKTHENRDFLAFRLFFPYYCRTCIIFQTSAWI